MSYDASSRRPQRKQIVNGFALFRRQILLELKQQRQRLTEDQLTTLTAEKWEALDPAMKETWKRQAKEEKLRSRDEKFASAFSGSNAPENRSVVAQTPPIVAAPPATATSLSSSQVTPVPSVELPLPANPIEPEAAVMPDISTFEKFSAKSMDQRDVFREAFLATFQLRYKNDKNSLKTQRFYLVASQTYMTTADGHIIPAEICICEFTLAAGFNAVYCVPVKPIGPRLSNQSAADDAVMSTHGFNTEFLTTHGVSCQEIARKFLDMCKDREPACKNMLFFTPATQYDETLLALAYIFANSDVEQKYKRFTENSLGCLDDLAHGLFKFFDVDFTEAYGLDNGRQLDLEFIACSFRIRGCKPFMNSDFACDVHAAFTPFAHCCLYRMYFFAEIIAASINTAKFEWSHLQNFIKYANRVADHSTITTNITAKISSLALGESIEDPKPRDIAEQDDSLTREALLASSVQDTTRQQELESTNRQTFTCDTLPVQMQLPSGRRGLGRGMHLSAAECNFLKLCKAARNDNIVFS